LARWAQLGQEPSDETRRSWRERVSSVTLPRLRGLARCLLTQEAAARGDADAVAGLLNDLDAWRGLRPAPPAFLTRALAVLIAARPGHPAWRTTLVRWLRLWPDITNKGPMATLGAQAGLDISFGAEPPPGVPVAQWLLHQATRAITADDP